VAASSKTLTLDSFRVSFKRIRGQARRQLSEKLCQAWKWVQPNGAPCDMVCRGLMLALDRGGHIHLPPVKITPHNPFLHRQRPSVPDIDASVIEARLKDLGPLEFRLVRRTVDEALFNGLIEHHHYLGYTQPVGEQVKYMIHALGRPISCLAWSSAARHLGPRDRFIGWRLRSGAAISASLPTRVVI
jgi:hypothetical protein